MVCFDVFEEFLHLGQAEPIPTEVLQQATTRSFSYYLLCSMVKGKMKLRVVPSANTTYGLIVDQLPILPNHW